jgi:uncharacterized protein (TIGR03437 family)
MFAILAALPFAIHASDISVHTETTTATTGSVVTVTTIGIPASDLAWDPNRAQIYLSIPSSAGAQGNSVAILNPSTGQLGASAFAGSEPNLLSVSVNSQYLYVSLNGASAVQRMTLPDLGLDIQIPLGSSTIFGPFSANDVEASPASDHTVLVTLEAQVDPPEAGVVIYDDATPRMKGLCGFGPSTPGCVGQILQVDYALWSPAASEVYGAESGFGTFYTAPVSAIGFQSVASYPVGSSSGFSGNGIHYDAVTNYVYGDDGSVVNPASGLKVGTFTLAQSNSPIGSALMVPDGSLGLAFFLYGGLNSGGTYTIESFDINHFTPVAAVTIPNVAGVPTHLIRWGSNGLAFTTGPGFGGQPSSASAVYLISGPFVGSTQGPSLVSGGVLNAASFAKNSSGNGSAVAPGSLVQIYGNFVGATPQAETTLTLPSTLAGVTVTLNSVAAPLSSVSPFGSFPFINAQVPFEALSAGATSGTASVVVNVNGVPSAPQSIPIVPVAPGIFTIPPTGQGNAILVFQDPADGVVKIAAPTGSLGSPTAPVPRGQSAFFYATGLGALTPSVSDGASSPSTGQSSSANSTPTVLIGGVTAHVQFAGQAPDYPGVNQINIMVPANAPVGSAIPIQVVSADGTMMSNIATIAVR